MNKMYFLGCVGILAASAMLSSCSSDNDDPTPSPNPGSGVVYKWTTNGGLKACDHILFGTDDKENANGTQIGNGDQEFVFTGKQTLKKGTYLLKGWVYIADGAELTMNRELSSRATSRPRRHSSQSVAASSSPRVQPQSLSSLHLKRLPVAESLATGVASFSAARLRTTRLSSR